MVASHEARNHVVKATEGSSFLRSRRDNVGMADIVQRGKNGPGEPRSFGAEIPAELDGQFSPPGTIAGDGRRLRCEPASRAQLTQKSASARSGGRDRRGRVGRQEEAVPLSLAGRGLRRGARAADRAQRATRRRGGPLRQGCDYRCSVGDGTAVSLVSRGQSPRLTRGGAASTVGDVR